VDHPQLSWMSADLKDRGAGVSENKQRFRIAPLSPQRLLAITEQDIVSSFRWLPNAGYR
jgi:hypothetical protein